MTAPRGWGEVWPDEPTLQQPLTQATSGPSDSGSSTPPPPSPPAPERRTGLSLSDLMERVLGAIRAAPGVVWTFGGVVIGVLALVEAVVVAALDLPGRLERLPGWHGDDGAAWLDPSTSAEIVAALGQAVVSTLGWVVSTCATALLTAFAAVALAELGAGRRPSVAGVWRDVRPRLGGVLALALALVGTIALLVAAPAVLAGAVAGVGADGLAVAVALVVLAAMCVAVAFVVIPPLVLAVPALVSSRESAGVRAAMRRAWRLADRHRWGLVGIWLLTTIVLSLAGGVVAAPFGWLGTVVLDGGAGTSAAAWVSLIGASVSAAVTAPIGALVIAAVHDDLAGIQLTGVQDHLAADPPGAGR